MRESESLRRKSRRSFDLPDDVAYFNCAAVAPLSFAARTQIDAAVSRRARPWNLSTEHWLGESEERRALFAELIDADVEGVALVPSASYGLAIAAHNLDAKPGQRIVLLDEDFPSDTYTWRTFAARTSCEIVTVRRGPEQTWTQAVLASLDERVAIVAVPNVHWTDGALLDLVSIGAATRELGARLVIDASQSLGAMPLDLAAVRPDFLVSVGYKWLLGPYGLGYCYVAEAYREGKPLEQNWLARVGSENFASLVDYQEQYRPGARRFDVGERSALELTGAASASLRQIGEWGVQNIAHTLRGITDYIEERANALGVATSSGPVRAPHLLGLKLPPLAAAQMVSIFNQANVHISFRGPAIRIAPHMYTIEADVERLIGALTQIAALARNHS